MTYPGPVSEPYHYHSRDADYRRPPPMKSDYHDRRDYSPPRLSEPSYRGYDSRRGPPSHARSPPRGAVEPPLYRSRGPSTYSTEDAEPIKIVTGSKLYVGRVPPHATSEDLAAIFGPYGFIGKIDMKPAGYAFIHYQEPLLADRVVEQLGGHVEWQGIEMIIEVSHPRAPRNGATGGSCFVCGGSNHWYSSLVNLDRDGDETCSGNSCCLVLLGIGALTLPSSGLATLYLGRDIRSCQKGIVDSRRDTWLG